MDKILKKALAKFKEKTSDLGIDISFFIEFENSDDAIEVEETDAWEFFIIRERNGTILYAGWNLYKAIIEVEKTIAERG